MKVIEPPETIKVCHGKGYMIINKLDYDSTVYELYPKSLAKSKTEFKPKSSSLNYTLDKLEKK